MIKIPLHAALLPSLWISAGSHAKHPYSGLGHPMSPGKSEISSVIGNHLHVVQLFQPSEQYPMLDGKAGA